MHKKSICVKVRVWRLDLGMYPASACGQYCGEPVILAPLPEPELPEPPQRSPRRKPAPELLAPFRRVFDSLVTALPKSLQACLWNTLVDWLNKEWEEACLEAVDLPGLVVKAYRRAGTGRAEGEYLCERSCCKNGLI